MAITLEAAMQMSLDEITTIVRGPDKVASAELQALMTKRVPVKDPNTGRPDTSGRTHVPLAERLSQLMLEKNAALADRESEVDRTTARINPPSVEELAAEAQAIADGATQADSAVPAQANDASAQVDVAASAQVDAAPPAPPAAPAPIDYSVEDAGWKVAGVAVTRNDKGEIVRIVADYQITEEDGTPIGRATHFEGRNLIDLYVKSQNAHVLATRAFNRVKRQNLTFKQEPKTVLSDIQIDEAAKAALAEGDPKKMAQTIRAAIEAKYVERERQLDKEANDVIAAAINIEFMRRHLHDFKPCDANDKLMREYLNENRLTLTLDNLEQAFIVLMDEDKLVKVETPFRRLAESVPNTPATAASVQPGTAPAAAVNPAAESAVPAQAAANVPAAPVAPAASVVAQPAAAAPAPAPASAPVSEATASTPAAATIAQPAARRPGVNSSLPPGTLRAQRPVAQDAGLARKDFMRKIKEMSPEKMRKKLQDPEFVKQARAYGIQI